MLEELSGPRLVKRIISPMEHVPYFTCIIKVILKRSECIVVGFQLREARSTSLIRVLRHSHMLVYPNNALGAFFANLISSIFTKYQK